MIIQSITADTPRYTEALRLIEGAGLPIADLATTEVALFGICERDRLSGVVGVESIGKDGLLRSLVVEPGVRGRAFAQRLCEAVFEHAAKASMGSLYLITVDADAYFKRFDFKPIERDNLPDVLCKTAQFSALCPDSAIVMRRSV